MQGRRQGGSGVEGEDEGTSGFGIEFGGKGRKDEFEPRSLEGKGRSVVDLGETWTWTGDLINQSRFGTKIEFVRPALWYGYAEDGSSRFAVPSSGSGCMVRGGGTLPLRLCGTGSWGSEQPGDEGELGGGRVLMGGTVHPTRLPALVSAAVSTQVQSRGPKQRSKAGPPRK